MFNEVISLQLLNIFSILTTFEVWNVLVSREAKFEQLLKTYLIDVTWDVSNVEEVFISVKESQLLNI